MAIFRCKICGGELELDGLQTVVTCKYCDTTQTLPKLTDDRRANLYDRANHFRRNNDFDKAMGIYESILNEDTTDAEAYWSILLCRYGIEYVQDPTTHKRMPTVNRAQFTSIFDDEDYKSAISYADRHQRAIFEAEAQKINDIQKNILAISQKEEPFDVFICYKENDERGRRTQDSVLATELYHELRREGLKVFFSRITLEDKLGIAYEPYIFAALHSASVMVVVGTRPEHFNAVWVKNEWSRYLALIRGGARKTLIPAYRDMDPYDLPDEFSHLQAQDMSKLGFMQDLIRGVKKLTSSKEKKEEKPTATRAAAQPDITPLLKRSFLFLEDGEFDRADDFCEQVLNRDPENALAYLGKLMCELKINDRSDLAKCEIDLSENKNLQKALRFAKPKLKSELNEYLELSNRRQAEKAELKRLKTVYNTALKDFLSRDIVRVNEAMDTFAHIADYKDSAEYICRCQDLIEQLRAEEEQRQIDEANRAEQKRLEKLRQEEEELLRHQCLVNEALKRAKRIEKIKKRGLIGIPAIAILTLLIIFVFIPGVKYLGIVNAMNNGDYKDAYYRIQRLDEWGDSRVVNAKLEECLDKLEDEFQDYINNGQYEKFLDKSYYYILREDGCFDELTFTEEQRIGLFNALLEETSLYNVFNRSTYYDYIVYYKLISDYSEAAKVVELYNLYDEYGQVGSARFYADNMSELIKFWDIKAIRDFFLSDNMLNYYMIGKWIYESNSSKYIVFYRNSNGMVACSYSLPTPSVSNAKYYDIQDGELVFEDENSKVVAKVYKFDFIDANTVNVYCYADGNTYTLKRTL